MKSNLFILTCACCFVSLCVLLVKGLASEPEDASLEREINRVLVPSDEATQSVQTEEYRILAEELKAKAERLESSLKQRNGESKALNAQLKQQILDNNTLRKELSVLKDDLKRATEKQIQNISVKTPEVKPDEEVSADSFTVVTRDKPNSTKAANAKKAVEKIKERVNQSSVIFTVRFERQAGSKRIKAIIDEVIHVEEDCEFTLKAGEEFERLSQDYKEDTRIGDGSLAFLKESPTPKFFSSSNIYNSRVRTFNNMPLSKVKALIQATLRE